MERNQLKQPPLQVIARDQRFLRSEIRQWTRFKVFAERQIEFLESILSKTSKAAEFIRSLPKEIQDTLYIPQNWQKYPELDYINDMQDLF